MADEPPTLAKRAISPGEAQHLLARAAELEGERRAAAGTSLTLAELERAAVEAGIEATCVTRAAEEMGLARAKDRPPLREIDRAIVVERRLAGELTEALSTRIIEEARSEFASVGRVERNEGAVVWRSEPGAARPVTVTATCADDEVRLRLVQDATELHRSAIVVVGMCGAVASVLAITAVFSTSLIPTLMLQVVVSLVLGIAVGIGFGATLGARIYRSLIRSWSHPHVDSLQRAAERVLTAAGREHS